MKTLIKLFCIAFAGFLLNSCEKDYNYITPFSLDITSVKLKTGEVVLKAESNYIGSIIEKGFCISESSQPSLSDKVYVVDKTDLSEFEYKSIYGYESYSSSFYSSYDYNGYYCRKWNSKNHDYEYDYEYDYDYEEYRYSDIVDFKTTVKDLESGTKYYVCAYAKSKNNIVYSKVKAFVMK